MPNVLWQIGFQVTGIKVHCVPINPLAVDGWAVTFGTARRGLGGAPASVPITIFLYSDPLLCGFNVPSKGLIYPLNHHQVFN